MWRRGREPRWKPEVFQVIAGAISRVWQDRIDNQVQSSVGEHVDAFARAVTDAISYEFQERDSRLSWLEYEATRMKGVLNHLVMLHRPRQNKGASNMTKLDERVVFAHDTPVRRVCQECAQPWPCSTYEAIREIDPPSR